MRQIVLFITMAMLLASVAPAGDRPLRLPDIPQGETRYYKSYYATPKDKPEMNIKAQRSIHEESPRTYKEWIKWDGEGANRTLTVYREENCFNKNNVKSEFLFQAGNKFALSRIIRKWIAPDGTVIRERDLQHTDPSFGYPDNTFHVMTVQWAIRAMELKPKSVVRVWVWLDFTVVYPLILSVEGEERIKVDAGEFDCWRVEVRLDKKGINDLMGAIIARSQSRYMFWVEKGGTHGLVRLSWPISSGLLGRSSRYQTQDLVRVTK